MKRILLFFVFLLSIGHFVLAQQTVESRSAASTGNWWDNSEPWDRSCDGWWIVRPDLSVCNSNNVLTDIGPNNILINHNNNTTMIINGAWFKVQTLTLQAGASTERTFTAAGGGLSVYAGIVNNSVAYHTFITPIGIDASQVTINAAAGNFYFTQSIYVNANEIIFDGSFYTYVSGVIEGTGDLTKNGLGGLALSADNTYTGTTTVSAGTMLVTGDLASSAITVESGALLIIGAPSQNFNVSINDLTVNSGGAVQILEGNSLTVNGALINNGSFTIESSASGTGSLITNGSVSGTINVERYMPQYSTSSDGWHFLSSPVANQAISTFHTAGSGDDFYKYDELTGMWINRTASGGSLNGDFESNFTVGKGYLVAYQSPVTKSFTGTLNNADVSVSGLTDQGGADDGWHLLGNPFPSAIMWNKTGGSWGMTNIDGLAKIVVGLTGNYTDLVTDDIIPAMQGFIVQVSGGTPGSLTIPKSARTTEVTPTNWYKRGNTSEVLKLKISGGSNEFSDIVNVRFNDEATNEYDSQFDSHKLYGMATAPQLFTRIGEEVFSTNTFPDANAQREVDMDFIPGTTGEYTIEVIANTVSASSIYLKDLVTGQMIDISTNNNYAFNAEVGDNQNRFKLLFGATGINEIAKESLQAYISGQNLYILGEEGQATLTVYDIQGKQLFNEQVQLTSQFRQALDLPQGVYVVSVQSKESLKTAKVIIK